MKKYILSSTILNWLPLAVTLTCIAGLVYLTVQQNFRMNANDPQIQIAEDQGHILSKQSDLSHLRSTFSVDIKTSLAPFIIIYDLNGKPVAGNGSLDNTLPSLPPGVFDYAKQHGENRITWEPKGEVRDALVIRYFKDKTSGFIAVGRSLREIEKREQDLMMSVAAFWILSLGATLITCFLVSVCSRKK